MGGGANITQGGKPSGSSTPTTVNVGYEQLGAFGGVKTFHDSPVVQIANKYKIDPANLEELEIFEATGGSADNSGNLFRCQSGTSVGGYGVIRSVETLNYKGGQGVEAFFTAGFTTGVPLSLQFGGMFSLTETIAFGYDGANFSCLHSYGGVAELQVIEVTVTGAGNCTVTLDNDSVVIAVTNSDVQTNAFELLEGLEGDATLSAKWNFEQTDAKVFCISKSVGDKTGTFSVSGGVTATITELAQGVSKTDGHIAQADWNITASPFDGFDPTKINVYAIQFGYLGVANILFKIYNPNTGLFVPVHQIEWSNSSNATHIGSPNLKIGWTSASLGSSGTNLTVLGASGGLFLQGDEVVRNNTFANSNVVGSLDTTKTNLITIRNRTVYSKQYNLGKIFPIIISVDNEHNKAVIVEVYRNSDVAGTLNFQYEDEFNSTALVEKSGTTVTNGVLIEAFVVPAGQAITSDLTLLNTELNPKSEFVVSGRTVSGTNANDVTVAITWKEEK